MYSSLVFSSTPLPLRASSVVLPLGDSPVHAGFPSPAEDFGGKALDISTLLVEHPQATYFLRVAGLSMQDFGIDDGDILIVDRAIQARHRQIVVAVIDNEFTVKCLHQVGGVVRLKAGNPTYPDIIPKEGQTLNIWGVVTASIKRFPK